MPETLLAATAQGEGGAGPWKITLDAPVFLPFMEHSQRRDLREELYRAFISRASSGERDNLPLLESILQFAPGEGRNPRLPFVRRGEPGFEDGARSRRGRQALGRAPRAALPRARGELADLDAYARQKSGIPSSPSRSGTSRSGPSVCAKSAMLTATRSSAPISRSQACSKVSSRRPSGSSISTIRPADGEVPVWDPNVRFFRCRSRAAKRLPLSTSIPTAGPANKRGGAWMDGALRASAGTTDGSLPVAYLVCNMSPPVRDRPALMTFREVETLFHEFGHGLQHMLTTVDHVGAAGINNVEWDAVELPSQFMENWCYTPTPWLRWPSTSETGGSLPRIFFDKIVAARIYRAGSATLRQVYFATLDLALHRRSGSERVLELQRRVAAENTVISPSPEDRFLCSFSHIFAGGYAAGYYSYKWAEVLSADAFSALQATRDSTSRTRSATPGGGSGSTVLSLGGQPSPHGGLQRVSRSRAEHAPAPRTNRAARLAVDNRGNFCSQKKFAQAFPASSAEARC